MLEYRPWTWKIPENSSDARHSITWQDAFERVGGQAVFTRDVSLAGMLYGKILLSPYASARISSIDVRRAKALPGVAVSAIFNATGEWVLDYPTAPDKVLKALGKI
jgi:CO/xanthine dehydrogenase Mo-binding subunit